MRAIPASHEYRLSELNTIRRTFLTRRGDEGSVDTGSLQVSFPKEGSPSELSPHGAVQTAVQNSAAAAFPAETLGIGPKQYSPLVAVPESLHNREEQRVYGSNSNRRIARESMMNPTSRLVSWCAVLAWLVVPFSSRFAVADSADESTANHWAFRPASRPKVPEIRNSGRARTPVDSFLLNRLETVKLTFAPDADRTTLLRRAYLDLWGLPPTLADVDAFLADTREDAFEHVLDRLLASPRFGERWARHWLDVAGYADTVGFDIDATLIIQAEGKWRYRDYVIDAFNRDMPYDQFVREQLAGDEMTNWRRARVYTPAIRDKLIATGFFRNARDETHEPESNIPLIFYGVLHNTVDLVGSSLLGLTLQCARCHDHKFDPIAQKEYYQLMAFLTPAYNPRDWRPVYPWKAGIKDRALPDVPAAEKDAIDRHNRDIDDKVAECNRQLAGLRRPYEKRLRDAKLQAIPEAIRADTRTALDTPAGKRDEIQRYLAGKFEGMLRVNPQEVEKALSRADQSVLARLQDRIAALSRQRKSFGKIQALYDVGPAPATFLLRRGNHETPGKEVQPGFLKVLSEPERTPPTAVPVDGSSGRRLALAQWLTQPNSRASALLSRVMVNRLWQHLFGSGLVPTPDNFGTSGEPPTHPELLEWLSSAFADGGWRIKPVLKLMMMSTAYRQSSHARETAEPLDPEKVDPGNRLLWKMRLRRLEAEVIRDALLAVSGQLDATMGGPPVPIKWMPDGMVVLDKQRLPTEGAANRRSIYLLFRRAYNLSFLSVFDQPLVAVNCTRRDTSAVPLQALALLNDPFVAEQAIHFADRVKRLAGAPREDAIRTAFRLALSRSPSAAEVDICSRLLERQAGAFRAAKSSPAESEHKALVQLCHTLLNTSEFLYVE